MRSKNNRKYSNGSTSNGNSQHQHVMIKQVNKRYDLVTRTASWFCLCIAANYYCYVRRCFAVCSLARALEFVHLSKHSCKYHIKSERNVLNRHVLKFRIHNSMKVLSVFDRAHESHEWPSRCIAANVPFAKVAAGKGVHRNARFLILCECI